MAETFGPNGGDPGPEWQGYITRVVEATDPPPPLYQDVPNARELDGFEPGTPDLARAAARERVRELAARYPEPDDIGLAEPSVLARIEYVDDLIRPGRIVVVAAEESSGKTFAISGELAVRVALAGGAFAGIWKVLREERVLVLSEMHPDDDLDRLDTVCASLDLERTKLAGRYWRLSLPTAANGAPPLADAEWREFIIAWCRTRTVRLAIIDTATAAADVNPWGAEIQRVYRELRAMLADYPELALVLLVHLKKPQGKGERRLSDVLGEWGRWCDVVLLMEAEGLERTKLTLRKRVRRERRILTTKRGGLLVDAQDLEAGGPKVPAEKVIGAVAAKPGISYRELAPVLGVSKDTASNYVKALADRLTALPTGPRNAHRVYLTAEPPNTAEQDGFCGPSAVSEAKDQGDRRTAEPPYIDRRSASAVGPADRGEVEGDYPQSAWDTEATA